MGLENLQSVFNDLRRNKASKNISPNKKLMVNGAGQFSPDIKKKTGKNYSSKTGGAWKHPGGFMVVKSTGYGSVKG